MIPTGVFGKSALGVGFVGGKWSPDPSQNYSCMPLSTGRKAIQDAQGLTQVSLPSVMQRANLATQDDDFLIRRADIDSPPFSIDSVPRGPDGDGLDFARLMGTHLNLCLEQRKFVQCQAADSGSVFLLMDDVILGIQTAVDRVKAAGVPFFSNLSHHDSGLDAMPLRVALAERPWTLRPPEPLLSQ